MFRGGDKGDDKKEARGTSRFRVAPRDEGSHRVIAALQKLYRKKLRPVEEAFSFERFHYDAITDTELEAKSQVLVLGQYSTGKTTFIRHLLGADFPNMNIGPEPTTDKFTVVIHGEEDRPVEGNSLAVIKELPYEGLTRFGTGFLNKLDAAVSTSPFLENMTLVDTPGILSGEMQRHQRSYSFADVARWFADRSDMILLIFDAHRLDVSHELMEILKRLKDHQGIIRIVLNKADQVDRARLRRVYGALMWSMGKVFDNPEVVRVYFGSFWDQPLKHTAHVRLFEADQESLMREMTDLPRLSAIRKINQLIKRTSLVRAHACVLSHLREEMPWMYGKDKKREELLRNLKRVVKTVQTKHGLHEADMPEADALRTNLQSFDFSSFPTLTRSALRQLNDIVDVDIHKVLKEGGGSEKIFKFSRYMGPQQRPGVLARAGSSMMGLFRNASAARVQEATNATTKGTPSSSPSPTTSPTSTEPAPTEAADGSPQAEDVRSADTGRSSSRSGMVDSDGDEDGVNTARRKNKWWICFTITAVLLLVLVVLVVVLYALEPAMASQAWDRLNAASVTFTQQARLMSDEGTDWARRLWARLTSTSRDHGEDKEDSGHFSLAEEVEALYRGTVH